MDFDGPPNPLQEFADTTAVELMFQGINKANWGTDPTFDGGGAAGTPDTWPKFVAVFINQFNAHEDEDHPGESYNSGSVGIASPLPFRIDDIGLVNRIVADVIAWFEQAALALGIATGAIDTDRIFACGFSDGGYMCFRMLQESGPGGLLTWPLRGIFVSGAVVGGKFLNNARHTTLDPTGIEYTSLPLPGVASKCIMMVHGGYDPFHQMGGEADRVATSSPLVDGRQPGSGDSFYWNDPTDGPDHVSPADNPLAHSVLARSDYTIFASANTWADAWDAGLTTSFPPIGSGPIIFTYSNGDTVEQFDRISADWAVRVWYDRHIDHIWPSTNALQGNDALYEGIIIAWQFFSQYGL